MEITWNNQLGNINFRKVGDNLFRLRIFIKLEKCLRQCLFPTCFPINVSKWNKMRNLDELFSILNLRVIAVATYVNFFQCFRESIGGLRLNKFEEMSSYHRANLYYYFYYNLFL